MDLGRRRIVKRKVDVVVGLRSIVAVGRHLVAAELPCATDDPFLK